MTESPQKIDSKVGARLLMQNSQESKDFYKTVKQMYKKVTKIFKLRMRTSTFPVICMSDLARVMRDIGLIPSIKKGMSKVKCIWFKVKNQQQEE